MTKHILHLILIIISSQPILARDITDLNIKLKCTYDESLAEEIHVDVKNLSWNKDKEAKANWGTVSSAKVIRRGQSFEATILSKKQNQIVLSYIDEETKHPLALVYEIDIMKLEYKKTSLNIFNNSNYSLTIGTGKCKKF